MATAAEVNAELGLLDSAVAQAIVVASLAVAAALLTQAALRGVERGAGVVPLREVLAFRAVDAALEAQLALRVALRLGLGA